MIERGDEIVLSDPVKNINDVTGAFRKELDYLIQQRLQVKRRWFRYDKVGRFEEWVKRNFVSSLIFLPRKFYDLGNVSYLFTTWMR